MSLLSRIGYDWAVRCFGADHCLNLTLRSQRTLEEAAELAQALELSREAAHKTIDAVYDRPVGKAAQEIGGVLHTVGILCESMLYDPEELHEREVRRVLTKSPEHFAKRNQEKLDLGLDASAQSSGDLPRTFDAYADIAAGAKARDIDARAATFYQAYVDNHPMIHSNRFPSWSEIAEGDKDTWRRKARAEP